MSQFSKIESKNYDCCSSIIAFILNNGEHEFSVKIEIMLKCLKFATDEGKIPAISENWWTEVVNCCDKIIIF